MRHPYPLPDDGDYNVSAIRRALGDLDVVAIEWAWREQGLVVASGNPLGLSRIEDLAAGKPRVAARPPASGARVLMDHLLERAGIGWNDLAVAEHPARSEAGSRPRHSRRSCRHRRGGPCRGTAAPAGFRAAAPGALRPRDAPTGLFRTRNAGAPGLRPHGRCNRKSPGSARLRYLDFRQGLVQRS